MSHVAPAHLISTLLYTRQPRTRSFMLLLILIVWPNVRFFQRKSYVCHVGRAVFLRKKERERETLRNIAFDKYADDQGDGRRKSLLHSGTMGEGATRSATLSTLLVCLFNIIVTYV